MPKKICDWVPIGTRKREDRPDGRENENNKELILLASVAADK